MLCVKVFDIYFQVHVSSSSRIASHCSVFALSDSSDSALRQKCEHDHDEFCDQCESLHIHDG